jgi:hypothetical protein
MSDNSDGELEEEDEYEEMEKEELLSISKAYKEEKDEVK